LKDIGSSLRLKSNDDDDDGDDDDDDDEAQPLVTPTVMFRLSGSSATSSVWTPMNTIYTGRLCDCTWVSFNLRQRTISGLATAAAQRLKLSYTAPTSATLRSLTVVS